MGRNFHLFVVASVLVLIQVAPASTEDTKKPEDLAKDAALRFAKAFNEHSVEGMIKVADLPFFYLPEGGPFGSNFGSPGPVVKTEKELRQRLKEKVLGTLPGDVHQVVKYAHHRDKLLVNDGDRKALDEIAGEGALIVWVTMKRKTGILPIFVKVRDDQARVVGFVGTWRDQDE